MTCGQHPDRSVQILSGASVVEPRPAPPGLGAHPGGARDEWVINDTKVRRRPPQTGSFSAGGPIQRCETPGFVVSGWSMDPPGVGPATVNAAGHSSFSEVFPTDARTSAGTNAAGSATAGRSDAARLNAGSHIATAAIDFERTCSGCAIAGPRPRITHRNETLGGAMPGFRSWSGLL